MKNCFRLLGLLALAFGLLVAPGCRTAPRTFTHRKGDEIVVAGQLFHTGTRVITWMDPNGYDAYRIERRFSRYEESSWGKTVETGKGPTVPNRYSLRASGLTPEQIERVRGGGWDLPALQQVVDQFVIHYDAAGISKTCFKILHDMRGLSVHFLLDVDGTVYQTLDLKERAWHATSSNDRSIGIEIANLGAYQPAKAQILEEWYPRDAQGRPVLQVPAKIGDPMIYRKDYVVRPARPELIRGNVQGTDLVQYDYTPAQYAALVKLTAALCKLFPRIACDYPRDADGKLVLKKLPDETLKTFGGVIGHFHIQTNKVDPGPAFQWDWVIEGARRELGLRPIAPRRAAARWSL
ncbi:MAG: N-acetylmuramoyl-L-alanine amidase [Opitutae bacterium]|nr:N-acetylmuramoyl-L-alanine amidase [Opitutae bacterium]